MQHVNYTASLHLSAATSKGPELLGGLLDRNVRTGQDGQTKGLPIGPDTSLLLAETILCAIDSQLQSLYPQTRDFCIRFMDDLEFSDRVRDGAGRPGAASFHEFRNSS